MRRTLWLLSTLCLVALAGACASGGDEALPPTATLGTAPTTTAPPPPDPAVIPDDPVEMDEDYVQAVVDALFAVDAKATEIFLETRELDERGIEYLEAIYTGDELDRQVDVWAQTIDSETLLPGELRHEVRTLIQVFPDCVYFSAQRDYSNTSSADPLPRLIYLGITPKESEDDLNPTAWIMFGDGFNPDGSQPEDACLPE